jgi:hypothetical protein
MNPRLILAALLLTAPLLQAQDDDKKIEAQKVEITLAPAKEVAPPQKMPPPPQEPYRITINLKTTDGDRITTQKSYTLVATTNVNSQPFSNNPSIRDDSHVPVKRNVTDAQDMQSNTDIDLNELGKAGDAVYLKLRIETRGYAEGPSTGEPGHERANLISLDHQYTVNPTLPIGKLTTVYSSVDAANNTKVEIQVLVQPLSDK